jgi:glycosyltransferase involved in cell wall biosynthesis
MTDPLVSFLVPCFNYGRYLGECLDSIFGQRAPAPFEVIAIDDASTDDTARVLGARRDSRLRVITHPVNRGHVATMTEAIGEARGAFVARIDPDDRYRPDFLSATFERLVEDPSVGLVYGDAAVIDEHGRVQQESLGSRHGGRPFKGNELVALLEHNFVCAPTVLGRREAWARALPVPPGLAFNDWYLMLMIAREWSFCYVPRILAEYRVHPANHHVRIVRDRTEEPSVLWLLDRIFSERERVPALEAAKRRARDRIYAAQLLTLARKYFGAGMYADARRCYLRAVRHRPAALAAPGVARQLVATALGPAVYEGSKARLRALGLLPRT